MSVISSEISRSNDVFMKHHFRKHDGAIPIWAIVEVVSFGTLSKLIKNLKSVKVMHMLLWLVDINIFRKKVMK